MRRWGGGAMGAGILRKGEAPRRPQLLVFGYSCKLFRDDERALDIDQGKHLIPCLGDDSLKIDRYDGRGALTAKELAIAEGCGNSTLGWERLTPAEQRAERLCDDERYRALCCDEDEEEMYREEELKRIHMSQGKQYGQVEFNYDLDESGKPEETPLKTEEPSQLEDDEPFIPPPELRVPEGMALPDTKKLNTIVEKTALFIASQGTQMEILLKAKQSGNPQFDFLSMESLLHPYYCFLLAAIKEGHYKSQETEPKEEKHEDDDHYLHPSLAPMNVELAPSIPSISYKPSADCAYSMLVNQIKGTNNKDSDEKGDTEEVISGDAGLAPPGTESLPMTYEEKYYETSTNSDYSNISAEVLQMYGYQNYYASAYNQAEIAKGPVLYNTANEQQTYNDYSYDIPCPADTEKNIPSKENQPNDNYDSGTNSPKPDTKKTSSKLKLTHYSDSESNSDSETGSSGTQSPHLLKIPPNDQQSIIDKMASYVARNGNEFEQIVKVKGDPRFSFLDAGNEFNPYYKHKRAFYERIKKNTNESDSNDTKSDTAKDNNESTGKKSSDDNKKIIAPVSFSIKKIKESEPILPKPALPYESSEEEVENENAETQDKTTAVNVEEKNKKPHVEKVPEIVPIKEEIKIEVREQIKVETKTKQYNQFIYQIQPILKEHVSHTNSSFTNSTSSSKRKHHSRRERKNKSPALDRSECENYRRKRMKIEDTKLLPNDVITIDEEIDSKNTAEFIDLTEECNDDDKYNFDEDGHGYRDSSKNNTLQLDRKRRAAAFLSSLKSVSTAPIGQHHTLASAMVKTLHTLQNKHEDSSSHRRHKRDRSRSRKSKKKKSDQKHSRERYPDDESGYHQDEDSWRHSREVYKSKRRSRERHSKKSKRKKSSKDDRSPDYNKSRCHKKSSSKYSNKDSPRSSSHRSLSKEKTAMEEQNKIKKSIEYKLLQKQDELLNNSLKELVRETRKDFISSQPIKMAVDIFSNDTPNPPCGSDDEWEKDSNEEIKTKNRSPSSNSSKSSTDHP